MQSAGSLGGTRRGRRPRVLIGAAIAVAALAMSTGVAVATSDSVSNDEPTHQALYGRVDKLLGV